MWRNIDALGILVQQALEHHNQVVLTLSIGKNYRK